MTRTRIEHLMAALFLAFTLILAVAAPARADEDAELAERVDVLADELSRLREQLAIPETDEELTSAYGMGPAASKVYGTRQGVAVGGYGEFYFEQRIDGDRTADMYRFITYVGYKFNDQIVMNTEIEFEHGTTSGNFAGSAGSVSVEFSYLDFLLSDGFNVRAGNLLVPMGFVNELHEPPYYRGNIRPAIERAIIPSTWRELGAGAHGQLAENVRYTAYVLNGLYGGKFDEGGVRDGRQKGNRAIMNDLGAVAALHYETPGFGAAASGYYGGADHDMLLDAGGNEISVSNWVGEAHAYWRGSGFHFRGMVALSGIDGAGELGNSFDDPGTPDDESVAIPSGQFGWYLEAAYDIAPLFADAPGYRLEPWVRYEDYDLQQDVPDGFVSSGAGDIQSVTAGLQFLPHHQVVIKGEWEHVTNAVGGSDAVDEMRLGAGFVF